MSIQTDGIVTGPVDHTFVTDFDSQVHTARLDQMAHPTASVSMNSQKIVSLATPTASGDAATKGYVDGHSTSPGGSDGQVQFNLSSAFAGSPGIVLDSTGIVSALFHTSLLIGSENTAATASGGTGGIAIGAGAGVVGTQGTAVGFGAGVTGSSGAAYGVSASAGVASLALGGATNAPHSGAIAMGYAAATTTTGQCVIGSDANPLTDLYLGNGVTNATPQNVTYHASGASTGDTNGASITIQGGLHHGTGNDGSVVLSSGGNALTLNHAGTLTPPVNTWLGAVNSLTLSGAGGTLSNDVAIGNADSTGTALFMFSGSGNSPNSICITGFGASGGSINFGDCPDGQHYLTFDNTGNGINTGHATTPTNAFITACSAASGDTNGGNITLRGGTHSGSGTDGHVIIDSSLGTTKATSASVGPGTIANKLEIFDGSGTSLGFIPIYATIT